jgi:tetratricopeptide (TPR) repeat protein
MTPEFGALIQELEGIRLILYTAVILLFVWVFVVVVRSLVMATKHLRANSFETEANHLLEEGAYERLISLAQRTLEKRSNTALAHWYLGRCYALQGRGSDALAEFEKTRLLAPHWSEGYIDPYVRQLSKVPNAAPNRAVNADAHRRRFAPWWSPVTLVRYGSLTR